MRRPSKLELALAMAYAASFVASSGCHPVPIQGEGGGPPIPNGVAVVTTITTGVTSTTFASTGTACWSTVATGLTTGSGWSSLSCGHCDVGVTPSCDTCAVDCASHTPCAAQAAQFDSLGGAEAWLQCARACPPNTTMNEFRTCLFACNAAYPGLEDSYLPLLDCVACHFCSNDCNADSKYGDCSMLLAPPPA
jgi:hypothetical protein